MGVILITGFGFFSKYYLNTSEAVVRMLDGDVIEGHSVVGRVFPVSLRRVREDYPRLVESLRPSLVLALGLAPRARSILLELVHHNTAYFEEPDVDGHRAWLEPIVEEGPRTAETRLPVRRIMEECARRRLLPLRPSISAGTYLCNAAGYLASLYSSRLGVPGGFLHLPPHTDLAMRAGLPFHRPLREIIDTVRCVAEASLKP